MSIEKIIETKTCKLCSISFEITDKDLEFYNKISPTFNGQKFSIPAPTLCPDCRQKRRLSFRNERNLYKRKCDLCDKNMISIYSPDYGGRVYCNSCYRSDRWDPFNYGMKYDFSKTFFEQFGELYKNVPKLGLNIGANTVNCEYNNFIGDAKDCYLCFGLSSGENTFYAYKSSDVVDSVDISSSSVVKKSYFTANSSFLTHSFFVERSDRINDSYFISDCSNIDKGIFCTNLSNKKFVYKNEEVNREEYEQILASIKEKLKSNSGLNELKREFEEFKNQFPVAALNISNSENCVGNDINNSKDCFECYSVINSENCGYIGDSFCANDCWDCNIVGNGNEMPQNRSLEVMGASSGSNVYFSESIYGNAQNIFYSSYCFNNSCNLFGCAELKNKKYCILNKQYTREEYEKLVAKIIENMEKAGEWGEFFPNFLSPFDYNEAIVSDFYALTKEQASFQGFKWQDKKRIANIPVGIDTISAVDLPENIFDTDKNILNQAILSEKSQKSFRIIKKELQFYWENGIALPRKHPDERHHERANFLTQRKLFKAKCDQCNEDILTSFQDKERKILCEKCYMKVVKS